MAMSQEHKDALAQGRKEARAIKAYLAANQGRRRGRPVTRESIQARLEGLNSRISDEKDPLKSVELIQNRIDLEAQLDDLASQANADELEAGFVEHAAAYSKRKGISYPAWREAGVSAAVLKKAGIRETRRR